MGTNEELLKLILEQRLSGSGIRSRESFFSGLQAIVSNIDSAGPEKKDEPVSETNRRDPLAVTYRDLKVGDQITDPGRGDWHTLKRRSSTESSRMTCRCGEVAVCASDDATLSSHERSWKPGGSVTVPDKATKGGVTFDSVILPPEKKQAVLDAVNQVNNQNLIFERWGFAEVLEKGKAVSILLWGEPGTGKTLLAQAVADNFGRELKTITTAEIETPEPGGAERAIQKAFHEAGDAVLLFDECDSLISSRKHLGSIMAAQVNALLTELERFEGIVIFTTNRIEVLDEAFDRRLSLKLELEMPDASAREKIWRRLIPGKAPLAKDVDFAKLAKVEIAGGHIKNAVLKAARAAANQDIPVEMKSLTHALFVKALTEEVESMVAFRDAKQNAPVYGTPMGGQAGLIRNRGKVEVRRG